VIFVTGSAAHPIEIHPPSGFSPGVGKTRSTLLESRFFCHFAPLHACTRWRAPLLSAGLHAIKGARFDMFGISTMQAVKFVNHAPMRLQGA